MQMILNRIWNRDRHGDGDRDRQSRAKINKCVVGELVLSPTSHTTADWTCVSVIAWKRATNIYIYSYRRNPTTYLLLLLLFFISIWSHQFIERQRRPIAENQPHFWSKIFRRNFSMIYGNKLKSERNIFSNPHEPHTFCAIRVNEWRNKNIFDIE